jgi:hypothetical protein
MRKPRRICRRMPSARSSSKPRGCGPCRKRSTFGIEAPLPQSLSDRQSWLGQDDGIDRLQLRHSTHESPHFIERVSFSPIALSMPQRFFSPFGGTEVAISLNIRKKRPVCSSDSVNDAQGNVVKRFVTVRSSTARELPAHVFWNRKPRNFAISGYSCGYVGGAAARGAHGTGRVRGIAIIPAA